MSIQSIDDLLAAGWSLPNAVSERARLMREAPPQERYWAYGADLGALWRWEDKVRAWFETAAREVRHCDDEHTATAQLAEQHREQLRFIACYRRALEDLQENIVREHGEMKVFDPRLIDAAIDPDTKPLWQEG